MPEQKRVDLTTKAIHPDFDSGKGEYYMRQMKHLQQFGTPLKKWPRKPRRTLAEKDFFGAVDRRLSRQAYTVSISFDKEGRVIREEEE